MGRGHRLRGRSRDLDIVVNAPTGVGIVVVGLLPSDPKSFSEVEDFADDIYDVMLNNGIPSSKIRYLHADYGITSNWRATHDASSSELNTAIESWAVSQVNTSSTALAEQSPLVLYIGRWGSADSIGIGSDTLECFQLRSAS